MKILYLHQYYNGQNQSGGTRSYEFARRMVLDGHEVHLVTSYRNGDRGVRWFTTIEEGVTVHWIPISYKNHFGFGRRLLAFCVFALSATLLSLRLNIDIIFATSTPLTVALPGVAVSKMKRVPLVFEVRDLWPEMPIAVGALRNKLLIKIAEKLEKFAYFNSEAVVALSPGMKLGVGRTGYPLARVAVVPNACDRELFRDTVVDTGRAWLSRSILSENPVLLYAGTLGRVNGVGYLVHLASELRDIGSNVKILVVGDGAEKAGIVEEARVAGVLNVNLFFQDPVPKREVPLLFGGCAMSCSLFLDIPEMRVNSANKVFDSFAAGKPVLINYGGWMRDIIEETASGICVWQEGYREAARRLDTALNDAEWLRRASSAAKSVAEELFDREKLFVDLMRVLEFAYFRNGQFASTVGASQFRERR